MSLARDLLIAHAREGWPVPTVKKEESTNMKRTDPRLYSAATAATELGITPGRIRQLAVSRQVGHKLGRDWLFTAGEIDHMRVRRPGRPTRAAPAGD